MVNEGITKALVTIVPTQESTADQIRAYEFQFTEPGKFYNDLLTGIFKLKPNIQIQEICWFSQKTKDPYFVNNEHSLQYAIGSNSTMLQLYVYQVPPQDIINDQNERWRSPFISDNPPPPHNQYMPSFKNQYVPPSQNQYVPPSQNQYVPSFQNQNRAPSQNQYGLPSSNQYVPPSQNQYVPPSQNQYGPSSPNQYRPPSPNQYRPPSPNQYGPPSPNQYGPPSSNQYIPTPENAYMPLSQKPNYNQGESNISNRYNQSELFDYTKDKQFQERQNPLPHFRPEFINPYTLTKLRDSRKPDYPDHTRSYEYNEPKNVSDRARQVLHFGIKCDGCQRAIYGQRYKCLECPNFDLCQKCKDADKHNMHRMQVITHVDLQEKSNSSIPINNQTGNVRITNPEEPNLKHTVKFSNDDNSVNYDKGISIDDNIYVPPKSEWQKNSGWSAAQEK